MRGADNAARRGVKVDVFLRVRPMMPKELKAKEKDVVTVDSEAHAIQLVGRTR